MIDFHIIGLLHGQNNLERYVTPMVGAFELWHSVTYGR